MCVVKAVSVSLPTWSANVGYEEGDDRVLGKMKTGYPRCAAGPRNQHLAVDLSLTYP